MYISRHVWCYGQYCSLYMHIQPCTEKPDKAYNCLIMHSALALGVQVHHEVLEDVHVSRVRDGGGGRRAALAVDVRDGLSSDEQHERVHQRHVVLVAGLVRHLERASQQSAEQC